MKKMFFFAVAAMVSLSSCVKSSDYYTGKNEQMGFKSAVSRAIIETNADMTYPIAVSAVWDDNSDNVFDPYFSNAKFVYDSSLNLWKGEPAKYWPTSGNMHFVALCPYPVNATVTNNYKVSDGTFESVKFSNIDNNLKDQHDVLFSDDLATAAPQQSAQTLNFHHAYSQLNVTFRKTDSAAVVIVKNVSVQGVHISGTLTVVPVIGGESTATWATPGDEFAINRYFLDADATGVEDGALDMVLNADENNPLSPKPILVIPGAQTSLVIEYSIDGVDHTYTETLSGDWLMGYKYTYNFVVNVREIMFNCDVEAWVDGTIGGSNTTI